MLFLEHLLLPVGLDLVPIKKRTKLLRHFRDGIDMHQLRRDGEFDTYQSYQSTQVFLNVDTLVSFIGRNERQAVFVGIYSVGKMSPPGSVPMANKFSQAIVLSNDYHYEITKVAGFEDLEDRLVIDWGDATRAWHQWFREQTKLVVEVLPTGYVRDFPGYLNIVLSFSQLVMMVGHPTANREWHRMLGSVAGIYLILDTRSGRQYVGSAYGERGILGRWQSYATNGHAGNKELRQLVNDDPVAMQHFQFSILQVLDRTLTRPEVITFESLHKRKLGSRVHGLNSN